MVGLIYEWRRMRDESHLFSKEVIAIACIAPIRTYVRLRYNATNKIKNVSIDNNCDRCPSMQIDDKPIYGHGASCVGIAHTFDGNGCVGYSSFSQFVFHGNSWHVEV